MISKGAISFTSFVVLLACSSGVPTVNGEPAGPEATDTSSTPPSSSGQQGEGSRGTSSSSSSSGQPALGDGGKGSQACPCPIESYCDLATASCKVGCIDDATCNPGRICDMGSRLCKEGCRKDDQCGANRICEELTCRGGCRDDDACGAGRICEGLVCRSGCRRDGDCATQQYCKLGALACTDGCRNTDGCATGKWCNYAAGHTCAACADTFEPNESEAAQTEWAVRQGDPESRWQGTVCTSRDEDYGRISLNFTRSTFETADVDVVVTAADPRSTLQIDSHGEPGSIPETHYITGTGTLRIRHVWGGRCTGTCRPERVWLHLSTDSAKPISYEIVAKAT